MGIKCAWALSLCMAEQLKGVCTLLLRWLCDDEIWAGKLQEQHGYIVAVAVETQACKHRDSLHLHAGLWCTQSCT